MIHFFFMFVLPRIAKGDRLCDWMQVAPLLTQKHKGLGVDGPCIMEMLMVPGFFLL